MQHVVPRGVIHKWREKKIHNTFLKIYIDVKKKTNIL